MGAEVGDVAAPARVIAALDGALEESLGRGERPALAFDADYTIWDGDIGLASFDALLEAGGPREAAREALASEARAFGLADAGSALEIARRLRDAFEEGRYAEERAFAMMAWAFAGRTRGEALAFAAEVARTERFEARFRPEVLAILEWARERGLLAYVVSASPEFAVEATLTPLALDPERIVAMRPAEAGEGPRAGRRLLPRLDGHSVYGAGKLQALEARAPGLTLVGAFGDSAYDAPMLRAARVPVGVAMSEGLLAEAKSIPGLFILGEPRG